MPTLQSDIKGSREHVLEADKLNYLWSVYFFKKFYRLRHRKDVANRSVCTPFKPQDLPFARARKQDLHGQISRFRLQLYPRSLPLPKGPALALIA